MKSISRFFTISTKLIPLFFSFSLHHKSPQSPLFITTIKKIRVTFQTLGGTFIKLGQMLSARPDIVGPELSNELRNLFDKEPSLPFHSIKGEIETELQKPLTELFKNFDPNPLSTASIGQVHQAVLHNKKNVAVKVRRESMLLDIKNDLELLKYVVSILDILFGKKGLQFIDLYREFSDWIMNELDFEVEGRRADKFRENLQNLEGIIIPHVFWEYSSTKILTTEFIDGMTINSILYEIQSQHADSIYTTKLPYKIQPDLIIQRTIEALIKQVFVDRFFHGDLHPGNIIIQKNNNVAFIDFGIVGTIDNAEHTQILLVLLSLIDSDPEALMKVMLSASTKPFTQDERKELYKIFSREIHQLHEEMAGKVSLSHFITALLSVGKRYDIVWSPGLILMAKTLSQIDFVAHAFGLKTSIIDLIRPELEKYIPQSFTNKYTMESIYKGALELAEAGKKLPESIADLEHLLTGGMQVSMENSRFAVPQKSFLRHIFLIGVTILVSLPVIQTPFVKNSPFHIVLTIGIPLILFYLLGKILFDD